MNVKKKNLQVVLMVNLLAMMVVAYPDHGNVMYPGVTVLVTLVKMKPIVDLHHVKIVYMIGQLTALNAVIQLPISLA